MFLMDFSCSFDSHTYFVVTSLTSILIKIYVQFHVEYQPYRYNFGRSSVKYLLLLLYMELYVHFMLAFRLNQWSEVMLVALLMTHRFSMTDDEPLRTVSILINHQIMYGSKLFVPPNLKANQIRRLLLLILQPLSISKITVPPSL